MLESKIVKVHKELLCFLCQQPIEGPDSLRLRWSPSRKGMGLLGYFHTGVCGAAMESVLREKDQTDVSPDS